MRFHRVGVATAFVLLTGAESAAPAGAGMEISPCPGTPDGVVADCGVWSFSENRDASKGRRIEVRALRVRSTSVAAVPEPVVFLAGGPGGRGIFPIAALATGFARALDDRDLIAIDQRGTGTSHPLDCPVVDTAAEAVTTFFPYELESCHDALSSQADLTQYGSVATAQDLAEVVVGLGYERVHLYGVSYGTRLALVFARLFPTRVASLVLDAPAPIANRAPLHYARDAHDALDGVLRECETSDECSRRHPDVRRHWRAVTEWLADGAAVSVDGAVVRLTVGHVGGVLRMLLYGPNMRRIPRLIDDLHTRRDLAAFVAEFAPQLRQRGGQLAVGKYLSVTCAEDFARIEDREVGAAVAGTDFGDYWIAAHREACAGWPTGPVPEVFSRPAPRHLPVLVYTGGHDPVTPRRWGEHVAAGFETARHVHFPHGGHGWSGVDPTCKPRITAAFLRGDDPAAIDASCATEVAPHFE